MKRYQLVDSLSWQKSICSVFFESDDPSVVETLEEEVSKTLNQRLEVVDAWDNRNHFPATARPLFKTEQEIYRWLAETAKQKNTQSE